MDAIFDESKLVTYPEPMFLPDSENSLRAKKDLGYAGMFGAPVLLFAPWFMWLLGDTGLFSIVFFMWPLGFLLWATFLIAVIFSAHRLISKADDALNFYYRSVQQGMIVRTKYQDDEFFPLRTIVLKGRNRMGQIRQQERRIGSDDEWRQYAVGQYVDFRWMSWDYTQ